MSDQPCFPVAEAAARRLKRPFNRLYLPCPANSPSASRRLPPSVLRCRKVFLDEAQQGLDQGLTREVVVSDLDDPACTPHRRCAADRARETSAAGVTEGGIAPLERAQKRIAAPMQ